MELHLELDRWPADHRLHRRTRGVREKRYGPLGARNAHDAEPRDPRGSAVFSLCFSAEIDPPHPVERLDDREEELNEGATGTSGRGSTGELPLLAEVPPTDYATIRLFSPTRSRRIRRL